MNAAYILAGLGYGDCGKGATTDFLARETGASLIVRYNGGSQAGHNVVAPDGRHHCFSQFGSGMFLPWVKTYLSKHMLVNPLAMATEEERLYALGITNVYKRTSVDARALITTPFHKAVNVLQVKAQGNHTSCGMGIGQTREDHIKHGSRVLFAGDIHDAKGMYRKLLFLQKIAMEKVKVLFDEYPHLRHEDVPEVLTDKGAVDWLTSIYTSWPVRVINCPHIAFEGASAVIFEGAQGVLLDETHGEEGFNTWTDCTFKNAFEILNESGWSGMNYRIGVTRTYRTRHGDGPLKNELNTDGLNLFEKHNSGAGAQGRFRIAPFSLDAIHHAVTILGGVDGFALNHMDTNIQGFFQPELEKIAPIVIEGRGPTAINRRLNTEWMVACGNAPSLPVDV